ncbi:MAG: alkaline phosphatase PhoX [Phycisphaerales bacterium]
MTFRLCAITAPILLAFAANAQFVGPSTTTQPYVLPVSGYGNGITTTSILTVGDVIGGYTMVGIPDGLGALANGNGTFDLVMNHELGSTAGVVRAHGQTGAFVSRWNIASDLTVNSGRDHNTSPSDAYEWTGSGWSNAPGPAQNWNRFCSGDLAGTGAYRFGNLGTDARIDLNGEEAGADGRAYAHVLTGPGANQTWNLPHLGRFSWENSIANPRAQQKTLVIGTDDSTPGQVYMYIGNKTDTGNDVERAGLTNGNLFGIRVNGLAAESRTSPPAPGTRFDLFGLGDVSNTSGAAIQTASAGGGVTEFLRPEDGAWDSRPGHENDFYFVTTDRFNSASQVGRSRLWRLRFDDITNPEAGGSVTALLDGTEGGNMFDNLTIDSHGRILIEEDIGGQDALGKIWLYDTSSGSFGQIAQFDAALFSPGATGFLTRDEEASGIIDARDVLGDGWFLLDAQAHYGIAGELVEGGQLLALYVDPSIVPAPGTLTLVGLGGLLAVRRRRR